MHVSWSCGFPIDVVCKPLLRQLFFTSLFSLILELVSDFSTYCLLDKMHLIKYIMYLLAQLTLWNILYILLVCWPLKVVIFRTCLWEGGLKFVRHGEHLPGFSFCISLFFDFVLFNLVVSCFLLTPWGFGFA